MSTHSPQHPEFDELCSEIDEFGPLPAMASAPLDAEPEGEEKASLDGQILAGLVSPC